MPGRAAAPILSDRCRETSRLRRRHSSDRASSDRFSLSRRAGAGRGRAGLRKVAGDDRGVDAVGRDVRKVLEDAHRGVHRPHMVGTTPDVMVGARHIEEARDPVDVVWGGRTTGGRIAQRCPAGEPMLERQCMLEIAERWLERCLGQDVRETTSRGGVAGAEGLQPALRFLPEALDGASGGDSGHDHSPMMPEVR